MTKRLVTPFRLATAVLAEDLADGWVGRRRDELEWLRRPANKPDDADEQGSTQETP